MNHSYVTKDFALFFRNCHFVRFLILRSVRNLETSQARAVIVRFLNLFCNKIFLVSLFTLHLILVEAHDPEAFNTGSTLGSFEFPYLGVT